MGLKLVVAFSAILIVALLSNAGSVQQKSRELGEATFSIDSDRIVVQVRIMGKGPYRMIVRSGFPHSYVESSIGKETRAPLLGLPLDGYDGPATIIARFKDIELGTYQTESLGAILKDLSGLNTGGERLSFPVQGVLGFNLLDSRVVQIDYPAKVIRFLARPAHNNKNDAPQGDAARFTLPLRFTKTHAFPVIDEVYVAGKKIKAVLDTGYAGLLALTPRAVKSLGLPTTGSIVVRVGMAPEISLTPEVVPEGSYQDKPVSVYGAIIGARFLSGYVLTLNCKDKMATFERR